MTTWKREITITHIGFSYCDNEYNNDGKTKTGRYVQSFPLEITVKDLSEETIEHLKQFIEFNLKPLV